MDRITKAIATLKDNPTSKNFLDLRDEITPFIGNLIDADPAMIVKTPDDLRGFSNIFTRLVNQALDLSKQVNATGHAGNLVGFAISDVNRSKERIETYLRYGSEAFHESISKDIGLE